jgi:hypothetical protein
MGRVLVTILACFALGSGAAAQDLPVNVLDRSTVSDDAYEETVLKDPDASGPGWRVRIWTAPGQRDPEDPPLRAVVVIDGQADVGVAAAMARQAGAVLADDRLIVVTVSPADEGVAQTFRRRDWPPEERSAMARFLRLDLIKRLRGRPDVGSVRLVGLGRGADVALLVFSEDPAAFDTVYAKDYRLPQQVLTKLSDDLPTGKGGLVAKLNLSWTQNQGVADPSAMIFLQTVQAKSHPVEWKVNETDEQFLWRSLFNP